MRLYDYCPDRTVSGALKALWANLQTRGFSGGTLAAKATSDPDLKTTTTIYYSVGGISLIKTAAATIDLSTMVAGLAATAGTGVQAAGKYAAYLITLDGSGNFQCYKGSDAATAALALTGNLSTAKLASAPSIPAPAALVELAVLGTLTAAGLQAAVYKDPQLTAAQQLAAAQTAAQAGIYNYSSLLTGLPVAPAGKCPVGILVVTNTTNPFIVGTTNSDATGVTFTCYDISGVPPGYGLGSVFLDFPDES